MIPVFLPLSSSTNSIEPYNSLRLRGAPGKASITRPRYRTLRRTSVSDRRANMNSEPSLHSTAIVCTIQQYLPIKMNYYYSRLKAGQERRDFETTRSLRRSDWQDLQDIVKAFQFTETDHGLIFPRNPCVGTIIHKSKKC